MAKAYVLINIEIGWMNEALNSIRSIPEIVAVDPVSGSYDIVAVLSYSDASDLGRVILSRLHSVHGVKRTHTLIVVQ